MSELLARMFDDWPLAVLLVSSEDSTITYANKACLRGVPAGEDWTGRHFSELAIAGWGRKDWSHGTTIGRVLEGEQSAALPSSPTGGCFWVGSLLPVDGEVLGTEHITTEDEAQQQHDIMVMRTVAALELEHSLDLNRVARRVLDTSDAHLGRLAEQLASSRWPVDRPPMPRAEPPARTPQRR